jgi:hypothetical protein
METKDYNMAIAEKCKNGILDNQDCKILREDPSFHIQKFHEDCGLNDYLTTTVYSKIYESYYQDARVEDKIYLQTNCVCLDGLAPQLFHFTDEIMEMILEKILKVSTLGLFQNNEHITDHPVRQRAFNNRVRQFILTNPADVRRYIYIPVSNRELLIAANNATLFQEQKQVERKEPQIYVEEALDSIKELLTDLSRTCNITKTCTADIAIAVQIIKESFMSFNGRISDLESEIKSMKNKK